MKGTVEIVNLDSRT